MDHRQDLFPNEVRDGGAGCEGKVSDGQPDAYLDPHHKLWNFTQEVDFVEGKEDGRQGEVSTGLAGGE